MFETGQNPKRDLSLKLTVIARQLRKGFDQSLEGIGVTRSQWTVIAVVARQPGATQRLISEILEMSEAAAGRSIDRLCADGLLERRPKPDDKRAYCVYLTDAARPLLQQLGEIAERHETKMFEGFDDTDIAAMRGLLDRIYANVTG